MIKHKLLEKTDWASVAAARPLTVLFPPVEALRNFGRRRKITNDDCERLGSSVLRPELTYRPKHRGGAEPDTESIQNLDIRINGQPVGAYHPRCNGPSTDTTSQSMLLDHEFAPTTPKPPVHEYVCENIGVGSSVVEGSRILGSSSVSPLYVSSSDGGLSLRSNFMVQGSDQSIDESKGKEQLEVRGLEVLQSADASPEVQEAWTPIRRRFTLDDQIRAEEERKAKAAYDTSLEIDDCSTAHLFLRGPFNPRLSSSAASSANNTTELRALPLVIWHGLGDTYLNPSLQYLIQAAEAANPGTYTYLIHLSPSSTGDRQATFLGNLTTQVAYVCDQLARDPILSTAPAINALGFSQGGQFLRAYIERCNNPPVRTLITLGSQHNGISQFQSCAWNDFICRGAEALLHSGRWSSFVQGRLVPAQYFRDPEPTEMENYLQYSNFLADVNNEREVKNETYKENLSKLEKFVMYMFEEDRMVVPKESSWFGEVDGESGDVVGIRERRR
ncbi:Antifungal peptide family protein [Aspergillus niger]|uniref:Palmitoyl-protein thioesterase 1 n=1 Tax=Aspergillus niger TaxID=5061 RepID=A0A505I4A6_ASPNG|nr:Antifungal peptide family protein [Aspergillus niger]